MIGIISPQVFEYIPSGPIEWRIKQELLSKLIEQKKVLGYPIAGEWLNIHSKKDLQMLKEYFCY